MVGRKQGLTLLGVVLSSLFARMALPAETLVFEPGDQGVIADYAASEYAPGDVEEIPMVTGVLPAEFAASGLTVRPAWYFRAEAMALKPHIAGAPTFAALVDRLWVEDVDTGTFSATDTVAQRLELGDLGLGYQVGGRGMIGRTLGDYAAMELSYFQVGDWNEVAAVHDATVFVDAVDDTGNPTVTFPASLFSPFTDFGDPAVAGLDYNSVVSIGYASRLYNVECNFRRWVYIDPQQTQVSLLIGWRYMNVDGTFSYHTESDEPAPFGAVNDVRVETFNRMYGVQLGAACKTHIQPTWWVDCEAKAAFFDNNAGQATEYVHAGVPAYNGIHRGGRREHVTTSAFDLKLTLTAQVTPRLAVCGGYQAIWLYHLALAPNNFNTDIGALVSGPALLNDTGNAVFHGPHLSVTFIW